MAHLCQRAGPVPSSWFLTTLPVCSFKPPAGLLHPAADPGVRRVAFTKIRAPKCLNRRFLPRRPTLRSSSSTEAARVQLSLGFSRALPSCRSPSENGSTPGFSSSVRVLENPLPCGVWFQTTSLGFALLLDGDIPGPPITITKLGPKPRGGPFSWLSMVKLGTTDRVLAEKLRFVQDHVIPRDEERTESVRWAGRVR